MTIRTREIYYRANGDRWLLALGSDTDRVFVRHEPNLPSGSCLLDGTRVMMPAQVMHPVWGAKCSRAANSRRALIASNDAVKG